MGSEHHPATQTPCRRCPAHEPDRSVKTAAALLIGLVLIAAAAVIAPAAWHSMQLRLAADDPAALADLRLKGGVLTPEWVEAEIAAAVTASDAELARSFIALAEAKGLPVSAEQQAQ